MKRILAIVILSFACVYYVVAQNESAETKNQISVIYGDNKTPYRWFLTWEPLSGAGESKGTGYELLYSDGRICIQYLRTLTPKIEAGLHFKYEEFGVYSYDRDPGDGEINKRNETYKSYCFTAIGQLNFLKQEYVRIYNKSGVGVSPVFITRNYLDGNIKETDCEVRLSIISVLGMEVGPKYVKLFGELGIGAQGKASVGLRSRF